MPINRYNLNINYKFIYPSTALYLTILIRFTWFSLTNQISLFNFQLLIRKPLSHLHQELRCHHVLIYIKVLQCVWNTFVHSGHNKTWKCMKETYLITMPELFKSKCKFQELRTVILRHCNITWYHYDCTQINRTTLR